MMGNERGSSHHLLMRAPSKKTTMSQLFLTVLRPEPMAGIEVIFSCFELKRAR